MLIDILVLIAVGLGFFLGYRKGFVVSLFTVIAWIAGLFAALKLTDWGSELVRKWFHTQSSYVPLITFILIFIGMVILVILFGKLIDRIISVAELGVFNKILGALMKGALFLLLLSVILWLFNMASVITPTVKAQSKTYTYVAPIAPGFFHFVDRNLPALKGMLDNLGKYFNSLNDSGNSQKSIMSGRCLTRPMKHFEGVLELLSPIERGDVADICYNVSRGVLLETKRCCFIPTSHRL